MNQTLANAAAWMLMASAAIAAIGTLIHVALQVWRELGE